MIGPLLLAAALLLAGAAAAQPEEPPERIRLQKQWLAYLGYFEGPGGVEPTSAWRAARMAFADDAGVDPEDRPRFHAALKTTHDANVRARLAGCPEPSRSRALACRDAPVNPPAPR